MKKILFGFCLVLAAILAGCSSSGKDSSSSKSSDYIGEKSAKEIALEDAGFSEKEVSMSKSDLEEDEDGTSEYEIEFSTGGYNYSYDIDAETGDIRSSDQTIED